MAILSRGQSFASGDQVTAQKLQDIVDLANFNEPADGATIIANNSNYGVPGGDGKLKVPSNGIGSNELASDPSVDANRAVGTDHIKDNSVTAAKLNSAAVSVLMPTSTILPYAGSAAPTGYFLCDGSAKSRTTYAGLFAIIGTTYGVGDGSTTFNIPDLRGRVIAGQDDMGGSSANRLTTAKSGINGDNLGAFGGLEDHLLTAAESGLPAHSHTQGLSGPNLSGPVESLSGGSAGGRYTSTGTVAAQDASSAHNNVQPTIILNYIIKT